jgi:16S rRNA processing protein RimM
MTLSDTFELGYIIRSHGLKGEVLVALDTDDPEAYEDTAVLYLLLKQGLVPYKVERFNLQKQGEQAIVKLKGIDRIEDTEGLKGTKLYLPAEALPALDDDQFYYHDIVGYTVIDRNLDGDVVGTVGEVYEMPQQVMLGVLVNGVEALVPLNDDFLVKIDKPNKRIIMQLPDGLIDVFLGGASIQDDDF